MFFIQFLMFFFFLGLVENFGFAKECSAKTVVFNINTMVSLKRNNDVYEKC